jgi:hypothetical protein
MIKCLQINSLKKIISYKIIFDFLWVAAFRKQTKMIRIRQGKRWNSLTHAFKWRSLYQYFQAQRRIVSSNDGWMSNPLSQIKDSQIKHSRNESLISPHFLLLTIIIFLFAISHIGLTNFRCPQLFALCYLPQHNFGNLVVWMWSSPIGSEVTEHCQTSRPSVLVLACSEIETTVHLV